MNLSNFFPALRGAAKTEDDALQSALYLAGENPPFLSRAEHPRALTGRNAQRSTSDRLAHARGRDGNIDPDVAFPVRSREQRRAQARARSAEQRRGQRAWQRRQIALRLATPVEPKVRLPYDKGGDLLSGLAMVRNETGRDITVTPLGRTGRAG